YVVVLVCLLVALAREGGDPGSAESARLHRTLGVIFVVLNFYWLDNLWFYLPVPVLLGWLIAARWLFPEKNVELTEKLRAAGGSREGEGKKLVELSRAARRYRVHAAAGTEADLKDAESRLKEARKAAAAPESALRDHFFGVPDRKSPWDLGRLGAITG